MQQQPPKESGVVVLPSMGGDSEELEARKEVIREWLRMIYSLPHEKFPTAAVTIAVTEEGKVRNTILNVEPEIAPILLQSLEEIAAKLRAMVPAKPEKSAKMLPIIRAALLATAALSGLAFADSILWPALAVTIFP